MDRAYIVIGSGDLAVRVAQWLQEAHLPVRVFEKKISAHSQVQARCDGLGIAYAGLPAEKLTTALLESLERGPVLVISAVNTYIFPAEVIEHEHFLGINYHNALLPAHRGMNAEAWAIYDMDEETGITWHILQKQVDQGPIIAQVPIPLNRDITALQLLSKQSEVAFTAFVDFAPRLIRGDLHCFSQKPGEGVFHYIKDVPNDGFLDLSWPMDKILALLRALDYGILYSLGKPHFVYEEKSYTAARYRVNSGETIAEEDCLLKTNKGLMVRKKGSSLSLELLHLQAL